MKIISFAWTADNIRNHTKTVTRRWWTTRHARKFKAGDLVAAYDKLPMAGGKKIAIIRITRDAYKQPLRQMPIEHVRREGIPGVETVEQFIEAILRLSRGRAPIDEAPWVIEFEYPRPCLPIVLPLASFPGGIGWLEQPCGDDINDTVLERGDSDPGRGNGD